MPIIAQIGDRPIGAWWDVVVDAGKSFLSEEAKKLGSQLTQQVAQAVTPSGTATATPAQGAAAGGMSTATRTVTVAMPPGARATVALPPGAAVPSAAAPGATGCYFAVGNSRHECTRDGWRGAVTEARAIAARGQVPVFVLYVNGQRISMKRCVMPSGQMLPQGMAPGVPGVMPSTCPAGTSLVRDRFGRAQCMTPAQAAAQGLAPQQRPAWQAQQRTARGGRGGRRGRRGMQGLGQSWGPVVGPQGPRPAYSSYGAQPAMRTALGDWYGHEQRLTQNALARYGIGPQIPPYIKNRVPPRTGAEGRDYWFYRQVLKQGTPAPYMWRPDLPGRGGDASDKLRNRVAIAQKYQAGNYPKTSPRVLMRMPPTFDVRQLGGLFT